MTLRGMDTVGGLRAGAELERGAQEIRSLASVVEQSLRGFTWVGRDADETHGRWEGEHRPALDAVATAVDEIARLLRQEAQAQDDVSEATAATATTTAAVAATAAPAFAAAPDRGRALVDRAASAGLRGEALDRYAERVAAMTPEQRAALDPATFRGEQAQQPDPTTCGSSSLVMARMMNDPAYAMQVLTGYDPTTGATTAGTAEARFEAESLAMHERTNGWLDRDGDPQSAWPQAWGTAPGPLAQEMSATGGSGVPGTDYGVDHVRLEDRGASFDKLVEASRGGHAVPVYVGSEWAPRHVVLVTGTDGGNLTFYEPSSGQPVTVTREDWAADRIEGLGGWTRPWAIVTPRS